MILLVVTLLKRVHKICLSEMVRSKIEEFEISFHKKITHLIFFGVFHVLAHQKDLTRRGTKTLGFRAFVPPRCHCNCQSATNAMAMMPGMAGMMPGMTGMMPGMPGMMPGMPHWHVFVHNSHCAGSKVIIEHMDIYDGQPKKDLVKFNKTPCHSSTSPDLTKSF